MHLRISEYFQRMQILNSMDTGTISVTLQRDPGGSLGFSLRGGVEHGLGHFVSSIDANSEAEAAGVIPGDQILRVDGLPLASATHKEAVTLISTRWKV